MRPQNRFGRLAKEKIIDPCGSRTSTPAGVSGETLPGHTHTRVVSKNIVVWDAFTRKQTPWPLVRKRTIPTERPILAGEF
jgi:hypothetical protein